MNNKEIELVCGPLTRRKCRHCGDRLYQSDDLLCGPCSGGWKWWHDAEYACYRSIAMT